MKGREKQIEEMEMAREIHNALLNCHNNYNCHKCEFRHDTPMSFCKAEHIAKAISEHYQPKLPEDSVVISREEYVKYINLANIVLKLSLENTELKQASKEMAEKYKGFIKELLTNGDDSITTYYGDVKYRLIREDDLQELVKQFSVGIKE